ncbi:MAG: prephenate/arogenate dehydrogenase family protein [Beijerinckiaceae bacterium]
MPDRLGPALAQPVFQSLALIGMGLIGSSIARAARRTHAAARIVAIDADAKTAARVRELGIADVVETDAAKGVQGCDGVILCVPVGANSAVAALIAPALQAGAILSDVGSVKGAVVRDVGPHVPDGVHFIPGHPVAGTEQSGPDAGFAALFINRWHILTPDDHADAAAVAKLRAFWEALGANVDIMDVKHHDLVLAVTSHLPHLIAYNIVGTANDLETVTQGEVIKYSAGGFRDFTRIAASDPTMWRDVFLNNREAVLEMLGRFQEDLFYLQRAIRWGEGDKLFELFSRTRDIRRGIVNIGQETDAPDFGRVRRDEGQNQ